ncbi:MAG: Tn7-like element transposition protein TnsE [Marinisporobacter sp.]|jgi:hypothetical protein|nr:Tn7-like element transposition protein TnsE [Marinisporobacter sp.]
MIDTYFKCEGKIRRIDVDWATIHFLHVGRSYIDGNMNGVCADERCTEVVLDLSEVAFRLEEHKMHLRLYDGEEIELDTKIFVGKLYNMEYRIPAIEIIRGVIGINNFILNRLVELDSLDMYFVYRMIGNNLMHIDFSKEYDKKLLSEEQVRNLMFLIGNKHMLRMFHQINKNIVLKNDIDFELLFDTFIIDAMVIENDKLDLVRVREITRIQRDNLCADNVQYTSPYSKEVKKTKIPKERVYRRVKKTKNNEIDPKIDGADFSSRDEIETYSTIQDYKGKLVIKRLKQGTQYIRDAEDENTKVFDVENSNIRTTADSGGLDRAKGLEYKNIEDIVVMGELEEFIEILKLLKDMEGILNVVVIIDDLLEGLRGKRFSKLSDGETNRRYAAGIITMSDGKTCCLIEIEREEKSLSMLILNSNRNIDWNKVIAIVTLGLVNKSGNWDSKILNNLETNGVGTGRIRHKSSRNNINEKSRYIYLKVYEN